MMSDEISEIMENDPVVSTVIRRYNVYRKVVSLSADWSTEQSSGC